MILKPAARYPADPRAVFILALSVFSGMTALALSVAPDSLEAELPSWGLYVWGGTLGFGSLLALIGMAFQSINGIITEQVGNVMVGAATLFYVGIAAFVVDVIDKEDIQTLGIVFAWGASCLLRWLQLQILINSAHRRQVKQQMLSKIYEEIEARARAEIQARQDRRTRRP